MKTFLEITLNNDNKYYLTQKNWYDWNKQGNWSSVGMKFGTKEEIWFELKNYLERNTPEYIFGKEYILDLYNQWNREKKLNEILK
jgi:hypothetical protein